MDSECWGIQVNLLRMCCGVLSLKHHSKHLQLAWRQGIWPPLHQIHWPCSPSPKRIRLSSRMCLMFFFRVGMNELLMSGTPRGSQIWVPLVYVYQIFESSP